MNYRTLICAAGIGVALLSAAGTVAARTPNIILIFTDDQGYQDIGCFGSKTIKTPHLDQMAAEGLRLTGFYAQPVCGVSRAALMTGSYPIRVGEPGNEKRLHTVPHPNETTMAEVLKSNGYATGIIGKWHLTLKKADAPGGFDPATMPNAQGFDFFYGTPLFNGFTVFVDDTKFRSPIFRNQNIEVDSVETWDHITADYTREAISWITENRDQPFFLYLAHNLPHIPVGASKDFKGKSDGGPYGDTIEEIDWSCGEIFRTLKELKIDDNTLVVFTSDNGPWVETTRGMKPDGRPFIPRDHSGNADPLRGWKMSAWEGGCRVPFIARWPGHIPAGSSSDEILSTMDLLPTFAAMTDSRLPEVELDGKDATAFLTGESTQSPRDEYFYYSGCLLTGVRSGHWKLVLPRPDNPPGLGWWGRMIERVPDVQLFNLKADPGETANVATDHPDTVASLMQRIERARAELGDIDQTGSGARFYEDGPRKPLLSRKAQAEPANAAVKPSYDGFSPLGSLRFTFESGKLDGWKTVDGKAGLPVSGHTSLPNWKHRPFNREGDFHLSTVALKSGFSDRQSVVFQSPSFVIHGDRASFLASGGFVPDSLFVGLFDAETEDRLRMGGGPKGPQMKRTIWDVSDLKGKTVFLRVVDQNTGSWGHLTFDDFSVDGVPVGIARREGQESFSDARVAKDQTETSEKDSRPFAHAPPNFVVIFADDQGYEDLGCFGSPDIRTPRLDQMAADGMKFTDFYAQPICGPSRAALMTGCYPIRVAERGNVRNVHPILHSEEITVAEILKTKGYATACFGKWDLAKHSQKGFMKDLLPLHQGFDYFFGTPTSNDGFVDLYRNDELIEEKADMSTLTRRYTDEAIGFMQQHRDKPFFVYIPHTMPHTRLDASERFKGKSPRGLYGDVIEEIDFNTGRILDAVADLGLSHNTYVLFTSDNGPWLIKNKDHLDGHRVDDHGGSAGPLRSGKVSTFEGGVRVPAILWGPGRVPQGTTCGKLACTLDILPTFAALAGAQTPQDRVIDGRDIRHLFHGEFDQADPDRAFFYYLRVHLQAVRQGKWKLHLVRDARPIGAAPFSNNTHIAPVDRIGFEKPFLVDLENDIAETTSVADRHPEVVSRLLALAEAMREDLGDFDRVGKNMRFFDSDGPRPTKPPVPPARKPKKKR